MVAGARMRAGTANAGMTARPPHRPSPEPRRLVIRDPYSRRAPSRWAATIRHSRAGGLGQREPGRLRRLPSLREDANRGGEHLLRTTPRVGPKGTTGLRGHGRARVPAVCTMSPPTTVGSKRIHGTRSSGMVNQPSPRTAKSACAPGARGTRGCRRRRYRRCRRSWICCPKAWFGDESEASRHAVDMGRLGHVPAK